MITTALTVLIKGVDMFPYTGDIHTALRLIIVLIMI